MSGLRYICMIAKINSHCELMCTEIEIRVYFEYSFFLCLFGLSKQYMMCTLVEKNVMYLLQIKTTN